MNFKRQPSEPHSRQSGFWPYVAVLAVLVGVGALTAIATSTWAEQTGPPQVDSANAGQITAVGSAHLEVEQRSYRLDPKLEIRTENGQSMELTQLQIGMGVRLHLKEGAISKIVVLNPK